MRNFAIIRTHDADLKANILEPLLGLDDTHIYVYSDAVQEGTDRITYREVPADILKSPSKTRNFVMKNLFDMEIKGFVHVLDDTIRILKDPTEFLYELERMMTVLGVQHWFNTITDVCNYNFKIYNPRIRVHIDEPELAKVYDRPIAFTSHSNPSWACYNMDIATYDDLKFDDRFTTPMFWIIKFLAEKRNEKKPGEPYYMNFYPTVDAERGVFEVVNAKDVFAPELAPEEAAKLQKEESDLWNSLGIDHHADASLDTLLGDISEIIKKRI